MEEYTAQYCGLEGVPSIKKMVEVNGENLGHEGTNKTFRLSTCCIKTAWTMNHGRNDRYACQHLKASDQEHFPFERSDVVNVSTLLSLPSSS